MAIKADNFFHYANEARTQGTIAGKKLNNAERKEAFKKQNNPVQFKTFVEKVLDRKDSAKSMQPLGVPKQPKALLPEGDTPAKRMRDAFDKRLDDLLKSINENVGGILTVIEKRAGTEEADADELKDETEKDKRAKKETDKENQKGKKPKVPGFIKKLTAPVAGWWETILKGFTMLLAGWGIDKLFKWLGDEKNGKAVDNLREFITVALPPILKGILAIAALGIALKVAALVKSIALGSISLVMGLKGLMARILLFAKTNPWLAAGIGLGALIGGAAIVGSQQRGEEGDTTQKFNEGGKVSGPGGVDKVPAKLTAGEFVMSKGAVNKWGVDTLEGMNAAGGGTNLPTLGGGGGGTDAIMEQAKTKTFGGALGDFFLGENRQTEHDKWMEMSSGGLVQGFNGGGLVKKPSQGGFGMTQKGGYIGSDAKQNRFTGPKNEAYFLQVEKKTGDIELWNEEWGSDKFVGRLRAPDYPKFEWNTMWWGGAKQFEKSYFGQPEKKKEVISRAQNLIKKSAAAREITAKTADTLINNPPGKTKTSRTETPVAVGAQSGGNAGGAQGSGVQPIFSALDTSNLTTLTTKSLYNIVQ